jgi:hypothetical protein
MTYLKQLLKEHGIEGENMEIGESNAMSGISRAISGPNVQKIISRNQMLYSSAEKQCWEIVKAWLRELSIPGLSVADDSELKVIYPKPKVLLSDKETLENIEKLLDLGLIEKWEALIIRDPNLDEIAAKEKLKAIEEDQRARRERLTSELTGGQVQQEGSEQDSENQPGQGEDSE